MTLEEVRALSDEELRIKVAELCGCRVKKHLDGDYSVDWSGGKRCDWRSASLNSLMPDYLKDRNPMHRAITTLEDCQLVHDMTHYLIRCGAVEDPMQHGPVSNTAVAWGRATARQLAEAFVLTKTRT